MLVHIIRKELIDQMLSLRFAIACAVCASALLLSALVLARNFSEASSIYHMNQVMHRNDVLQRTRVWDLWQGVTVDRPLNVMNALVGGMHSSLTESVKVQMGNRLDFPEDYEKNPLLPLFPKVDFVFITGIIMSLLALAFSYDAVSGEKESGVLKLVMSYSVPRDLVLMGKWIGGYLALVLPFLLSFCASMVVLMLFPEVVIGPSDALVILSLVAAALLYLAVVYSLGIFVSCRTEMASTSITVLLLVWVVFILAVPNMAPYLTSQLLPVSSRESVDREKGEMQGEMSRKYMAAVEEEVKRSGKNRNQVVQDSVFQEKMRKVSEEHQQMLQKVEDNYAVKIQEQTRWSGIVARISPLTSFNLAAFNLAASGIEQERRYIDALKKYSTSWEEYSNEKRKAWDEFMKQRQQAGGAMSFNPQDMERFNNLDLSDYPRFHFEHMSFRERVVSVWMDVVLLVVWAVLFFMLAYISFLRYDVQ
ncbi:MAG TPA: DUF3526 domain-containing protein [Candidatus Latescibacteria bacterium]|nr:DUF3526 domain-containing protein [Candidatus Latescibacterota bacterium]